MARLARAVAPLLALAGNWRDFLSVGASENEINPLRCVEQTGRRLGIE